MDTGTFREPPSTQQIIMVNSANSEYNAVDTEEMMSSDPRDPDPAGYSSGCVCSSTAGPVLFRPKSRNMLYWGVG